MSEDLRFIYPSILPFTTDKDKLDSVKCFDVLVLAFEHFDFRVASQIMPVLKSNNKSFAVLNLRDLDNTDYFSGLEIFTLQDLGVKGEISSLRWILQAALPEDVVEFVCQQIEVQFVISGAAQAQQQLVGKLSKKGAKVLGHYLSLNILHEFTLNGFIAMPVDRMVLAMPGLDRELLKNKYQENLIYCGYPKLDCSKFKLLPETIRKKPVLLFIGGYGEHYNSAFVIFSHAAKSLSDFSAVVMLHPHVDGKIEKRLLHEAGCTDVLLFSREQYMLEDLIPQAQIVVTQGSSSVVDCLLLNKPVYYVDAQETSYTSFPLEQGWIMRCCSTEELVAQVHLTKMNNFITEKIIVLEDLGINFSQRISEVLVDFLMC